MILCTFVGNKAQIDLSNHHPMITETHTHTHSCRKCGSPAILGLAQDIEK
jgi:hypothetical protein